MISLYLKDTKRATRLFAICCLLLCIAAALDLNSWPGQQIASFIAEPSPRGFMAAFGGYAMLVAIVFWSSGPSVNAQRMVIFAWPLSTFGLWTLLHQQVRIGWFGAVEVDPNASARC